LAASLTSLTKNSFQWSDNAQKAFESLKEALTTPAVLALPDFSLPFIIECDASATKIDIVLMQNKHPIAFISQEFKRPDKLTSAYERKMLAILFAVKKWRQYLLRRQFIIN